MQLQCSSCLRVLEYSGTPPVCCAHCGRPLNGRPTPSPNPFLTPRLDPADDGPVPETVGGYRLLRSLGAGGMGTVYEAEETASGRHVALKLLKPQAAASPESLERFRREGRLASQIAHPRCVFVYAADQEEGRPYIVMELMPGDTLADLVARQGPLAPGQAVATILDVIDGLQEAHQLGVIHRDVKPSNCFLLPDGRVKIGDFGLAKSLFADSDLTRTGTFLGTPYFASPEQVSDDPVDFRTDIYSVAATLYFLLTGQAPFQRKGNPAAVLASIVSKPPPSARELRPEVPPALDRVLRRGLERNPARRWKNLEAFRAALLPFAPGYRPFAALGIRLGAWLIDAAWFVPLWLLTGAAAGWRAGADGPGFLLNLTKYLADAAVWVAYFTLFEWLGGATLGKRFLGLRVRRPNGHDRPGLPRALLRALLFWAAFFLPADALGLFQVTGQAWSYLSLGLHAAGALLLASTMRAANGYRGLHELASGTCVVAVPRRQRRRLPESKRPDRLAAARNRRNGEPASIGPFRVLGGLYRGEEEQVLLAEDARLGRAVILWVRPGDAPPVSLARREVARPTRPRWLTCGQLGSRQWDAFTAPAGCPLPDLFDGTNRLPWRAVRNILEQLCEELVAGRADGTLPPELGIGQVWVQPNGRVQLVGLPLGGTLAGEGRQSVTERGRALALLRQVAVLGLEGNPRPADAPAAPVRAPVPTHAAALLDRLLGVENPYATVEELQADLAATKDRPTEVTPTLRAAHLGVLIGLLSFGLVSMLLSSRFYDFLAVKALARHKDRAERAKEMLSTLPLPNEEERGDDPDDAVRRRVAEKVQAAAAAHELPRLTPHERDRLREWLNEQQERDQAREEVWRKSYGLLARTLDVEETVSRLFEAAPAEDWDDFRRAALRAVGEGGDDLESTLTVGGALLVWPVIWIAWALLFRGGFSLPMMGLHLVQADGRRATRLQCGLRAALVWLPVVLVLGVSVLVQARGHDWLSLLIWWLALALLVTWVVLALVLPARSLHDRLARTYLVPR